VYRAVLAVVSRILSFWKRSYSPMGWNFTLRVVLRHHGAISNLINLRVRTMSYTVLYDTCHLRGCLQPPRAGETCRTALAGCKRVTPAACDVVRSPSAPLGGGAVR
jgi:hypothetical protein